MPNSTFKFTVSVDTDTDLDLTEVLALIHILRERMGTEVCLGENEPTIEIKPVIEAWAADQFRTEPPQAFKEAAEEAMERSARPGLLSPRQFPPAS